MKKLIYTLAILFLLSFQASFLLAQDQKLTHHMTPEEELRKHEIGRGFTPTDPPSPPVRMVAEFEEMQSVLVRYPFGIPMTLIVEMSQDCHVTTIVANAAEQNAVLNQYQSAGVNISNCEWLIAPTNSYWTRDYGPWFVVDYAYEMGISDFPYNRPRPDDDNIPVVLAQQMGLPLYGMNLIQTGGNWMCDGMGIAASTDLVWEENPSLSHAEIDTIVKDYLGVRRYHVLPDPLDEYIKHIDCWAKFLDVDKVLIGQVPISDYRYADFEFVANYFAFQTSSYGTPYQVYRVFTPGNYPYTPYTNSLILNKKVFVPQTGSQWDDEALEVYEEAMPGYEIIGILHNTWENTDALHCRAKGIADEVMLHVYHMPLHGQKNFRMSWDIEADIIPYSGAGLIADSVRCFYKVNDGEYQSIVMDHAGGYHYTATLPFAEPMSDISYYLRAADYAGKKKNHPFIGSPDPHKFTVKYATNAIMDPDTLVFLTVEEMLEGKTFNIYNYTNGELTISDIEHEGLNQIPWFVDPWPINLPYLLEMSGILPINVKVNIPVDHMMGMLLIDTLDITTQYGLKQVIIKVDEDLLSSITDPGFAQSAVRFEGIAPNPFTRSTTITLNTGKTLRARLAVYNLQGREVAVVADREFSGGTHTIDWNGNSSGGQKLSPGIYLLKLESAEGTGTRKLVIQ